MFLKSRTCRVSSELVYGIVGASNDILNGIADAAYVFRNCGFGSGIRGRGRVADGADKRLNGANEERGRILKIVLEKGLDSLSKRSFVKPCLEFFHTALSQHVHGLADSEASTINITVGVVAVPA